MKISILSAVLVALLCVSCNTNKENNLSYFKDLNERTEGVLGSGGDYQVKLQTDDELLITVSSVIPEATAMYNAPLTNPAVRGEVTVQGSPRLNTYVVDHQGNIVLPTLGVIHVAGLTVQQVSELIRSRVSATVKDPYVRVQLISFYVNVLGEVDRPQRVTTTQERFSVLDALAAAGDLTPYARRDNVLLIRYEDGKEVFHRFDLTKTDMFSSPYFYLQPGDVIYVDPNPIRIDNSKYNQNNAYKLSVISTVVSACSVVVSLIIALVVK